MGSTSNSLLQLQQYCNGHVWLSLDQVWTGRKQMAGGTTEVQTGCRSAGEAGGAGGGQPARTQSCWDGRGRRSGPRARGWGRSRGSSVWLLRRRVLAPDWPPRHPGLRQGLGRFALALAGLRAGGEGGRLQPRDARCDFPGCAPARPQIGLRRLAPPLSGRSPSRRCRMIDSAAVRVVSRLLLPKPHSKPRGWGRGWL